MAAASPAERFHQLIEAELNQERAALRGRYGRRVEDAIARCEAQLDQLDVNDQRTLDAYRSSRQQVLGAIADLCLQREMIGLTGHSWVDRIHRIPPVH